MIKECFSKLKLSIDAWHDNDLQFFPLKCEEDNFHSSLVSLAHANYHGWHYEDIAKSDVNDKDVLYAYKMTVIFNAQRNKAIEAIEKHFSFPQTGELCSESFGIIFDRFTILYLKKIHTNDKSLDLQLDGLMESAENLYTDLIIGKRRCLVYSHSKFYTVTNG